MRYKMREFGDDRGSPSSDVSEDNSASGIKYYARLKTLFFLGRYLILLDMTSLLKNHWDNRISD